MTTPTVSDDDALSAAVLAAPDDDLPRLVYADYLDERVGKEPCYRCKGTGRGVRYRPGRAAPLRVKCVWCEGSGLYTNGAAERAEFIRSSVSGVWAAMPSRPEPEVGIRLTREGWLAGFAVPGWWPVGSDGGYECFAPLTRYPLVSPRLDVKFSRGFAHAVRGPLSAFWEDRGCDWCQGTGRTSSVGGSCAKCREAGSFGIGTGRVSGPAPAFADLVRRHPVARVEVTDVEPFPLNTGRYTHVVSNGTHWLPRAGVPWTLVAAAGDSLYGSFESAEGARKAISAALIALARSRDPRPGGESRTHTEVPE